MAVAAGLCDADLAQRLLQPGQRSALFATRSRACGQRDELRARFVYLHTGDEIARLERGRPRRENQSEP